MKGLALDGSQDLPLGRGKRTHLPTPSRFLDESESDDDELGVEVTEVNKEVMLNFIITKSQEYNFNCYLLKNKSPLPTVMTVFLKIHRATTTRIYLLPYRKNTIGRDGERTSTPTHLPSQLP